MKKLIILSLVLFSCNKEEVNPVNESESLNCNCDRVVDVKKWNVVGEPQPTVWYKVTSINDCSKLQKSRDFYIKKTAFNIPVKGECWDMKH